MHISITKISLELYQNLKKLRKTNTVPSTGLRKNEHTTLSDENYLPAFLDFCVL